MSAAKCARVSNASHATTYQKGRRDKAVGTGRNKQGGEALNRQVQTSLAPARAAIMASKPVPVPMSSTYGAWPSCSALKRSIERLHQGTSSRKDSNLRSKGARQPRNRPNGLVVFLVAVRVVQHGRHLRAADWMARQLGDARLHPHQEATAGVDLWHQHVSWSSQKQRIMWHEI